MDAVEPARKQARAYVRVLNTGSLAAIQEALTAGRLVVRGATAQLTGHRETLARLDEALADA